MKKIKNSEEKTARRYAIKLLIDIKHDILFGEELMEYIVASVKHDTRKSYHNERFYDLCEDAILDLYEKYTVKCSCCKKFIHRDVSKKYKDKRYCKNCVPIEKKQKKLKKETSNIA